MRHKALYIVLSLVVSVILMGILLKQIDPGDLKRTFLHIHLPSLFAYIGVYFISVWLRAWRYKILLCPQPVAWKHITLATLIRNCFDDLLPARVGSLSYIYVLNQRLGLPFKEATSSFIVAFVLDFLTLGPFLILAILAVGLGTAAIASPLVMGAAGLFFLLMLLVLWKIVPVLEFLLRVFISILRGLHLENRKASTFLTGKTREVIQSLSLLEKTKLGVPVLIQSFFIRLCKYASVYLLLYALLRSHGYSLADLSFWKTILGLTGAEFTAVLPIKGLAGFGTWETAWVFTFKLLDFPDSLATISGIGIHLITNISEYSLGILSILILALPSFRSKKPEG